MSESKQDSVPANIPVAREFVGRSREMAQLEAALSGAESGEGRFITLSGEPGIGKTRTAQELARRAQERGVQVLWGWCYEGEGAPSYWPWVDSLRTYVQQTEAGVLGRQLGTGAATISEMIPAVLEKLDGIKPPPEMEPDQARFRLFDAITGFLKKASEDSPLLLVLDDLQWADRPTLLLLEFVARQLDGSRILIVGTYRDTEAPPESPLGESLGRLSRLASFQLQPLAGLPPEDVGNFVQGETGITATATLLSAIHAHTEGNPFFLGEVARYLAELGQLDEASEDETAPRILGIPQGIRHVIGQRLMRLSEPCHQALTAASVIGREFEFNLLTTLIEPASPEELLDVLDEAISARIIEDLPGEAVRYQFRHALMQQTLTENISTGQKVRLHARIGEALEEGYGDNPGDHAAELAHHFSQAQSVLGNEKMLRYILLAGDRALASYAHEEGLAYFQRGLTAKGVSLESPEAAEDFIAAELLFGLGRAQAATLPRHELIVAHRNFSRAFDHYESVGDTARMVAIAEFPFPQLSEHRVRTGGLILRALENVPEDSLEAGRLYALYGHFLGMTEGDYGSARDYFDRALAIAKRDGVSPLEMRTLISAAQVELWHNHIEDSLKSSLRAIDLAVEGADLGGEVAARYWASISSTALGDIQEIERQASAILEPAERLRDRWGLATAYTTVAWPLVLRGEWKSAREVNQRSLDVMPMDPRLLFQRVVLETQTGNQDQSGLHLERLEEVVRQSEAGPNTANTSLALASPLAKTILGANKRPNQGEASITAVLSSPSATPFFSMYARVGASLLAAMDHDAKAAVELYTFLKPLMGGWAWAVSIDRVLGLLAQTMGDLDQAAAHFEDALTFCRDAGYRPELAWSYSDYADALLQRSGPGDFQRASSLLDDALSISGELLMRPLEGRVIANKKRAESGPVRASAYPGELTQREVDVIRRIAAGRTDREIAEELIISVRTVTTHVGNILNKTGAANRAEAASFATRHGLA